MGSTHAIRLGPGAEVREALLGFVRERGIRAACVVSAVGSLTEVPPPSLSLPLARSLPPSSSLSLPPPSSLSPSLYLALSPSL